jgi:hypothetical protein
MFAARTLQRFQTGSRNVSTIQKKATKIFASISLTESKSRSDINAMTNLTSRLFSAPAAAYNQTVDTFPSIVIGSDGNLSAQGPFAESQAQVSDIISFVFFWAKLCTRSIIYL